MHQPTPTPNFSAVRHLLVDLDGTLVDAWEPRIWAEFILRFVFRFRKEVGWRGALGLLTELSKSVIAGSKGSDTAAEILTNELRAAQVLGRRTGIGQAEAIALLEESTLRAFLAMERHFKPVPGAAEFIDAASKRYPMILATNPVWPLEVIHVRVRRAGLDPALFKRVTCWSRMSYTKPRKEYFEQILQSEGLSAGDCLMIGNDPAFDLAATEAGIPAVIVDPKVATLRAWAKLPEGRAPAWTGSYRALSQALFQS